MNTETEELNSMEKNEGTAPAQTINAAIVEVMRHVKRLEKADQNTFGKYAFTSVDDFKDFIRPLLAEQGLSVSMNENSFELRELASGKEKITATAIFNFSIQMHHAESKQSTDPEMATIALPYTGAQSSGAARSYALKEWMKGRFMISTGDIQDEADARENSEFVQNRMTKADAREPYDKLTKDLRDIADLKDPKAIKKWWIDNQSIIKILPQDWSKIMINECEDAFQMAEAQERLDRVSNDDLDAAAIAQDGS